MNPFSPLYREQFEAHQCVRCKSHYVEEPGSMCGPCKDVLARQAARKNASVRLCRHVKAKKTAPQSTTLDLFGC